MKILIETRTPSAGGGPPTLARRTVSADWIRVGRNASCELHLPDPRIALEQGMIVDRSGLVYIEGEAGSQDITRKSVRATRLKPGVAIEIGPFRIEAKEPPPGYDGAIVVERLQRAAVAGDLSSRSTRLTLASLGIPKRAIAWTLAALVLIAALVIPAGRVLNLPWKGVVTATAADRLWDPGPLTLAHQTIAQNCAACHEFAFRPVRDGACLACHRDIGEHASHALRPAALFSGTRCAQCHLEHKGLAGAWHEDDHFCIACHRDLRAQAPQSQALDASDFATAHPAFRLTLADGASTRRVRQGGQPIRQHSTLIYPHAPHLDPKGVRSPDQGRVHLECVDCHHADASGRGFEPVSMKRDCQSCHGLQFEPAVTSREAPHGNPAEAVTVVQEFYANLALNGTPDSFRKAFGVPGEGLLRRVGEANDAQREDALRLARRKADGVARDLVEVRVCKTCHVIERDAATPAPAWKVEPLLAGHAWMPHARFDHKAHAASKCGECHDVAHSKSADDVAMPTIATCRKCHAGTVAEPRKVVSNCMLCHDFHDRAHARGVPPGERTVLAQ